MWVTLTYISWSSDSALYLECSLMYEHHYLCYESVWSDSWPKIKCRSLWTIFHGPVIICYILKTIWCMIIIVWDYGSVWHSSLPQNKCRSVWPIFHGPVLYLISSTFWCLSVIFTDNDTVWPKLWPQSKLNQHIFHGLVILLNIFQMI